MTSNPNSQAPSDAVPTAKFLQARITALSTTLIKRLENIFAVALDDTASRTMGGNAPVPPSLTETSAQQFQLDVESTAVIRAAEEIMMLTRTMKEIWLFGGLDTLAADHEDKDVNGQDEAAQRKMEEDIRIVEEGFRNFLESFISPKSTDLYHLGPNIESLREERDDRESNHHRRVTPKNISIARFKYPSIDGDSAAPIPLDTRPDCPVSVGMRSETKAMTISTPPSTTLSAPPSPTELPTSNLPPADPFDEERLDQLSPSQKRIIKTTTTVITPIFMRPKPIYIIVATSLNPPMGIGFKGKLPWPAVKADMAFFKQLTSHVPVEDEDVATKCRPINAVVMGRKTWDSIPPRFRPLAGRLNVIITRGSQSDLSQRILGEMQATSEGPGAAPPAPAWETHHLAGGSVKGRSRSRTSQQSTITVLTPPSQPPPGSSKRSASSPIMISQSLSSALAVLSSPTPISLSSATAAPTSTPTSTSAPPSTISLSIHKIFCIGGAEIYRQVLALSSHGPRTPTGGAGSETGTDTEGESQAPAQALPANPFKQSESEQHLHFDVRILQTQIRKLAAPAPASTSTSTSASASTPTPSSSTHPSSEQRGRTNSKVAIDFECDTFFPDLLPSPGSGVKSAKWRPVLQLERVQEWIGGDEAVTLPQHAGRRKESIQDEVVGHEADSDESDCHNEKDGKELWFRDEKAGVECRTVGWERR